MDEFRIISTDWLSVDNDDVLLRVQIDLNLSQYLRDERARHEILGLIFDELLTHLERADFEIEM